MLLRSLEPDDGDEVTGKAWESVWAAELDRRLREVAEGKVELIDGDQVDAEIRAMLDGGLTCSSRGWTSCRPITRVAPP